ncbi:hypothetical protein HGM15179_014038 [Zosterops borbonicus]|uniref:Uncharacterized protein n=1 Tax=Zosterops borbonicus TaxID=364589 RepID=A0A8K1G7M4_9PASS|nr:hypothetical protein HGM15179_014038 [Zosterops borbonicus]
MREKASKAQQAIDSREEFVAILWEKSKKELWITGLARKKYNQPGKLLKLNTSTVESTNGKSEPGTPHCLKASLIYQVKLSELGLFSLEKRQGDLIWGYLIAAFRYPKGAYKRNGEELFARACIDRTRGNEHKLKESRFRLDIMKKFFAVSVVRHWNRLSREVVDAPSLAVFKARLDGALSNLV